MLSPAELIRLLDEFETIADADHYVVVLDDGDALVALDDVLASYAVMAKGTSAAPEAIGALAARLDEILVEAGHRSIEEDPANTFGPFVSSADVAVFLDQPGAAAALRVSRDVRNAATYAAAVGAVWGARASAIARRLEPSGAADDRLEREILAVAGVAAVPVSVIAFTLDRDGAYRFLSSVFATAQALAARITAAPVARPEAAELRAGLIRLLRRKQEQVRAAATTLPESSVSDGPSHKHIAVLEYVGALLELRAESAELAEDLASLTIPKHRLVSKLSKMGVTDPILIDQNPVLDKLRRLQPLAEEWITAALDQAGRSPGDESLAHHVDRIAVTVGALRTRLAIIKVTERTIDAGQVGLYNDLEPSATSLDTALVFLELDKDFENVRAAVATAAGQASMLVTSYRWSRIVLQAMLDATDLVLAIETGGRMGGIGPALRSEAVAASGGAAIRAMGTAAELDRLLAGVTVVAMASKGDPQKNRKKGIKAEKGLGLSPNRPRADIGSITGTATARYPDALRFKSFWEVKNVSKLRLTRQMTDFILFAQASRLKMVLYIRPSVAGKAGTVLSPSLKQALTVLRKSGLLEIRRLKIY
ncbi:putative toxin [Streptomyces phaeochromogenes]|nr:putative toxin [Streptomyces phaeochromogenes]